MFFQDKVVVEMPRFQAPRSTQFNLYEDRLSVIIFIFILDELSTKRHNNRVLIYHIGTNI